METYLLKSAACLLVFFVFYKAALEPISAHAFKRFYLLGTLPASFLIPVVTFTEYVEHTIPTTAIGYTQLTTLTTAPTTEGPPLFSILLWSVYILGVLFFGIRFIKNLFRIYSDIRCNPKLRKRTFFYVLLPRKSAPHTFLNYIFLNKTNYQAQKIPKEVLAHEHAHAREGHSIDILLVELLHVFFWFNPLLSLLKRSIRLNHEFLADRAVLRQGIHPKTYKNLLLAYATQTTTPPLAHSINYSSIKKRFTVMNRHTPTKAIWLRSLLIIPLLALTLYGFADKAIVFSEVPQDSTISENSREKATPEQFATYNALAKKYNAVSIEKRKIPVADLSTMETIYGIMTVRQKELAAPFPECYLENRIGRYDTYAQDFMKGAAKNGKKTFVLMISVDNLTLNGKPSSVKTFREDLDAITKNWSQTDFDEALPSILISKNSQDFLRKLEVEFQKTEYANRKKGATLLIPPPPKAPSPKLGKKVGGNVPPPPSPKVREGEASSIPAPPKPPLPMTDPAKEIISLSKRGATFYMGPHQISVDEAIEVVRKNPKTSIKIDESNMLRPKVQLDGC